MNRLQILAHQVQGAEFVYSVPVTPKLKGQTPIYRNPKSRDALYKPPASVSSLSVLWDQCLKKYQHKKLIEDYTYKEVDEMAKRIGSWMMLRSHKLFYFYAKNSPQWTISDIASWMYGIVNVPLYDTLGAEAFNYILELTEGTLIFTTANMASILHKYLQNSKNKIKQVCFFDDCPKEDRERLLKLNVTVFCFKQILSTQNIVVKRNTRLQTQLTYIFTSGTTGIPKGVVYTHGMIITQIYGLSLLDPMKMGDVHMSYLPIPHCFERFVIWRFINDGVHIKYAKHQISEILKDFAICKPTILPIVPRLLNKFYPILKNMYQKQGNKQKIKSIFGGCLRTMSTGSAAVSTIILQFYKSVLEIQIKQGYGQTETAGGCFVTQGDDFRTNHVGGPSLSIQFKLVDVPEMNYFTDSDFPKGQVCIRGGSVFAKYFRDPRETKETIDKDGWNHTGDVGMILPNGALKIIDRKKNIYKLQQGEYIAPERIENIYTRCLSVAECFVYGDSLKDYNIAIVHPNLDALPSIAAKLGITEKDVRKLCENQAITNFIHSEITKQGKDDGLMGFEQAKKIKLWHEPFQVVGVVTNTMKLQRHLAKQKFKTEIELLYKKQN